METIPLNKLRETFILRIWRDSAESSQWRCHVQSARSGEVAAFQGIAAGFAYIQSQLEENKLEPDTRQGLR